MVSQTLAGGNHCGIHCLCYESISDTLRPGFNERGHGARYLVTISAVRYGPPAFHDFFDNGFFRPSGNMLGAIGVGVFFFITTFFDKALERYYSLYRFTGMMEGRIYDIVMAFQAHCEDGNARHQQYLQQLWRYVVARSPAPQRPCLGTLEGGSNRG